MVEGKPLEFEFLRERQADEPLRRHVNDTEYQQALASKDVQGIMRSMANKFRNSLDQDQQWDCCLNGLWRALGYHDPRHISGQKFLTSLSKFVRWECLRTIKKQKTYAKRVGFYEEMVDDEERSYKASRPDPTADTYGHVEECMERFLPKTTRELVRAHYFERRSVDELAVQTAQSKETVRTELDWAINRLREVCDEIPGLTCLD